jgi:cytochrome o ubiquinol oxidase subunit IV
MVENQRKWNISFKPLLFGFLLSVALTLVAYLIAVEHYLTSWSLIFAIFALAGIQALIQFVFFLHLGIEKKPHWNMIMFLFMVGVVVVVIGGSLWIMHNLKYNVMMMGH